ncbi:Uncharacterised protein [Klebsiella pneumoniae]|nr:Uncharacterised protein [Klebsiella pneumoniae]
MRAIRRINNSEASTIPTLIAITMSNSTVSDMHISITTMSSFGAWRSRLMTLCASLIFHATISSRAAIADSGSQESSGARISSARITSRAWITAATGDVAPARTFAAERAIAAVAVIPPKNGATMLPSPWPISSLLALCLVPVMPSSTTAHRRDSMAPSIAIEKAAGSRACSEAQLRVKFEPGISQGNTSCGSSCGMPLP